MNEEELVELDYEYFYGEADCDNCGAGVGITSPVHRIVHQCEDCGSPIEVWMEEAIDE